MTERLSSADVSFFYLEGRTTPQHVGAVAVLAPPETGFDYDRLVRLLEQRIALVPRYRQRVRNVPGHLANPVWVDDPNFDITYHVRRSALPRPGTQAQLLEFCARIQSRLLDRARPLWEMYLVEGLADGNVAIVTKTHHSMVDGRSAIDIAQVILDPSPESAPVEDDLWMPEPEPSPTDLVLAALAGVARRPAAVVDAVRLGAKDVRASTAAVTAAVGGAWSSAVAVVRPDAVVAAAGEDRPATAYRRGPDPAGRLPPGAPGPRRIGERRRAGDGGRCAAGLAAAAGRSGAARTGGARARAGERQCRGRRRWQRVG